MAKFIQQEMSDLNNTGKRQTYYRMDVKRNINTKEFIQKMTFPGEEMDTVDTKRTARSMTITGINFKADKQLVKDTACKCNLTKGGMRSLRRSPYTKEERWQMAADYLSNPDHPLLRLNDYMQLTGVSRAVASRELREYYEQPDCPITISGSGTSKVYVRKNE